MTSYFSILNLHENFFGGATCDLEEWFHAKDHLVLRFGMHLQVITGLELKIRLAGGSPRIASTHLSAKTLETFCRTGSRWKKWLFLKAYIHRKWKKASNIVPQFCPPTPHSPPGLNNAVTPLIKLLFCVWEWCVNWIPILVFLSVSLCVSCVVSMCVSVCLMCGECLSLGSYLVAAIV